MLPFSRLRADGPLRVEVPALFLQAAAVRLSDSDSDAAHSTRPQICRRAVQSPPACIVNSKQDAISCCAGYEVRIRFCQLGARIHQPSNF